MKNLKKIFSIILLIPLLYVAFVIGSIPFVEGYNPIDPTIDTVFTANYSEEKFEQIEVGMDSTTVVSIIGKPFNVQNLSEGGSLWCFSHDGKCSWQDFAWLGREIKFSANGKVSEKIKIVYYD